MKTKVCIFNDRKIRMNLQVQESDGSTSYVNIPATTYEVVEVSIKEGHMPYFKVWETGQALLSSIDPEVMEGLK